MEDLSDGRHTSTNCYSYKFYHEYLGHVGFTWLRATLRTCYHHQYLRHTIDNYNCTKLVNFIKCVADVMATLAKEMYKVILSTKLMLTYNWSMAKCRFIAECTILRLLPALTLSLILHNLHQVTGIRQVNAPYAT